jgi:hypothetical protein
MLDELLEQACAEFADELDRPLETIQATLPLPLPPAGQAAAAAAAETGILSLADSRRHP